MSDFNYYAKSPSGVFSIDESHISEYNEKQYDIFWTPQVFEKGKRKKEDLKALRFVFGDFDKISFDDLKRKLKNTLTPSMIVSTRSGFHVYWELLDWIKATDSLADTYREFVDQTLVACLGADEQAKDVC